MPIQHTEKLLRLRQILGDTRAFPPTQPIIPVSKSTWWAGVASGQFPAPVKLGGRATFWKESDIDRLIDGRFPGVTCRGDSCHAEGD